MVLDSDDAKTDIVLAGAAAVFGGSVRGFVSQIPGYPRSGIGALMVELGWLIAITALVPVLLSRHRGDRWAAFGLTRPVTGLTTGWLVAAPIAAAAAVVGLVGPASDLGTRAWWWGRLAGAVTVGTSPTARIATVLQLVVLIAGATLLVTFLAKRGASLDRSPSWTPVRLARTFAVPATVVAAIAGLTRVVLGWPLLPVIAQVGALTAVLFIVERRVRVASPVRRATVLAPAVVVAVLHLFAAGGLFRGDLLAAIHSGGLAVGMTVTIVLLATSRIGAWAVLPVMLVVHWWPMCLSPLALRTFGVC